jgi:glutamate synthase domain-containing protein 2
VALRTPYLGPGELLALAEAGVSVFHLTADYHGRSPDGRFVFDLIREAHRAFVAAGRRDEVTLLGAGGIIAAEHVAKAIIAGLDAVGLDTPLLVALQARFEGAFRDPSRDVCRFPKGLNVAWGTQRLQNLLGAWRDQLLEVLGAMGIREVRRLRGEMGRAMFQIDLEREAFAGIEGYPVGA